MSKWIYNNKEYDDTKFPKDGSAEDALRAVLWYNGYISDKEDEDYDPENISFCDAFKARLSKGIAEGAYSLTYEDFADFCPELKKWGTEEHCIWMFFVIMFGDYGTSPRSGWIDGDKFQALIDFLDMCEASICGYGVSE